MRVKRTYIVLAEVSANIIDQCVAQGVPFARDYGGLLDNRSFGGVQVSRTFYARGQTGQQLLLGAYSALMRQVGKGAVQMFDRHEMLDVVVVDGKARGIIARNLITGEIERHGAHAVLLCTGGYGNVFFLSTNAMGSNVTAAWKAHKRGAFFGNPLLHADPPHVHSGERHAPEQAHAHERIAGATMAVSGYRRVWRTRRRSAMGKKKGSGHQAEEERDYYLERRYPAFGNLVPRDVASRAAKERCDAGYGVNKTGEAVYLDFGAAIQRYGKLEANMT